MERARSSRRRPATRARLRALPRPPRLGAPYAGVLAGIVLIVAVFLPWYATTLGPPFAPAEVSGWEATWLARAALAMAVIATVAAAAAVLEERGTLPLDARGAEALAWIVTAASGVALVLVGYRLLVMPDPAQFLARQVGLYLAVLAAAGGVLSGLGLVATRR